MRFDCSDSPKTKTVQALDKISVQKVSGHLTLSNHSVFILCPAKKERDTCRLKCSNAQGKSI